ncbi:solute carrier family 23 protein [Halotalea alkalilenta]|uniref:uracil-xanthine permease family protein n=1 Tax=Halotalea alkalilenta TaxID=376489 RepID=UPI0006945B56
MQGTSFSFVASLIAIGATARERGADDPTVLGTLIGASLVGALAPLAIARWYDRMRRLITPTVTGVVITLIGLSLVKVGMNDIAGGAGEQAPSSPLNLVLAITTLALILACQLSRLPMVRIGSIFIGLVGGCLVAALSGALVFPGPVSLLPSLPVPFAFGLHFDIVAIVQLAFIYVVTSIETIGVITGTSRYSNLPTQGDAARRRVRGAIYADGVCSMLAAGLNSFPNTTFGQNIGVVQLTGVASRYVGIFVGVMLVGLSLLPPIGALLQAIPRPVLGGATLLMFGLIAVSGIRMLGEGGMSQTRTLVVALSLGAGFGVELAPQALAGLPEALREIFSSSIVTGGLTAILACLSIPAERGWSRPAARGEPSKSSG